MKVLLNELAFVPRIFRMIHNQRSQNNEGNEREDYVMRTTGMNFRQLCGFLHPDITHSFLRRIVRKTSGGSSPLLILLRSASAFNSRKLLQWEVVRVLSQNQGEKEEERTSNEKKVKKRRTCVSTLIIITIYNQGNAAEHHHLSCREKREEQLSSWSHMMFSQTCCFSSPFHYDFPSLFPFATVEAFFKFFYHFFFVLQQEKILLE